MISLRNSKGVEKLDVEGFTLQKAEREWRKELKSSPDISARGAGQSTWIAVYYPISAPSAAIKGLATKVICLAFYGVQNIVLN